MIQSFKGCLGSSYGRVVVLDKRSLALPGFIWLLIRLLPLAGLAEDNLPLKNRSQGQRPSSKANSTISFENQIERSGMSFVLNNGHTPEKYQIETMTGGVAALDYNNDGFLDIYFTNGAHLPDMAKSSPKFFNRLYRNKGDGTFTDATEAAGVSGNGYANGVACGDYDNDGFVDMYVAGVNHNQLFHNNGNGTFTDFTAKAGLLGYHSKYGKTYAITAGWFDYDRDGYLDLILINYVNWSLATASPCSAKGLKAYCSPDTYEGLPNQLFRNNRDGTFTDVSEVSRIGKHVGKGMGVAFADHEGDGFIDIFVANDTFRNFLFRNNGDGTFSETGVFTGVAYNEDGRSVAGMGADFRDIDNDSRPDIFETAKYADVFPLYRNQGEQFADVSKPAGLAVTTSRLTGWGNGIFDFDNDGWKDLFTANGAILDNAPEIDHLPYLLPNLVLRNNRNGTFSNVSLQAGASFMAPAAHRGAAFGDFDNDGRIDAVTTSLNAAPQLWMNRSVNDNHWLLIRLVGTTSNRDSLGARIKITTPSGASQFNHATTAVGYNASSDKRVHFGLGAESEVKMIEIVWPSGAIQTLSKVRADQIITIRESLEQKEE
jgi:hypothetical protein